MKTSVVLQPSSIKMGEIINELLSSQNPFFDKVWLISAFANARAIERLTESILASKNRGAQISVVVGLDVNSTSAEALQTINSLQVNSILVHNARRGHTFHPKIYLFEATNLRAELFVGSSNLTDGGLYTNYEASSRITFNFPQDRTEYVEILTSLNRYLNPQGETAQVLNSDLINILVRRGEVPTEREIIENQRQSLRRHDRVDTPPSPFGVEVITRPSRIRRTVTAPNARLRRSRRKSVSPQQNSTGILLWQKTNLPASDVQSQVGNPTGGLRLTQARWRVNGQLIDQTTYFRNDVFGNLTWREWRALPFSERTEADFDVYILGESYGLHQLGVSHKPS
ncbi:MAG: phospholipase D family protein [Chloroflexota bacterium]|nr:phospholipase D family protein [Chloroflexota bacterium]